MERGIHHINLLRSLHRHIEVPGSRAAASQVNDLLLPACPYGNHIGRLVQPVSPITLLSLRHHRPGLQDGGLVYHGLCEILIQWKCFLLLPEPLLPPADKGNRAFFPGKGQPVNGSGFHGIDPETVLPILCPALLENHPQVNAQQHCCRESGQQQPCLLPSFHCLRLLPTHTAIPVPRMQTGITAVKRIHHRAAWAAVSRRTGEEVVLGRMLIPWS